MHDGRKTYVALDVGPTGKLLKPMGDLSFEDAYDAFKETMIYGEQAGADLIHIETMSDSYEVKAAVLAAKENTSLPVFATMIFDEKGKLLTGGDVPAVVTMLEGLRVDALGINCGMGPEQMLPILEDILKYASVFRIHFKDHVWYNDGVIRRGNHRFPIQLNTEGERL